ncbi:hypothetical protein L1O48_04865 [Ligilactobacillus equi]|uniref:Uncharacterized protein n=1 Tax=Ligilactobacillus equi DPC 6820 TaxID=1392007 RepID=V7HYF5_9LACO|nr:hypothetical protein [Ligilactobacillus equi]ETA74892.1 hypothetical protein LEQ_0289c [Ligilactobacillus equi DPC 6820]MCQ2556377.1 hypothetical protein [Ligilactobacillus sp.]
MEERRTRRYQEQAEINEPLNRTESRRQNKLRSEEEKTQILKRKLDIVIGILSLLIILTWLFMRFINF